MEDSKILDLFFARSEEAITQIKAKYGNYCRVIAENILQNHEDAKECLNDTWLSAWNTIPPKHPKVLATYVGKLAAVVQSAIDEYASGDMTPERRTEVVYARFDELQAMEKECDEKVASVVSRMRELLKKTGQDDTLARQVEQTYAEEKSLKKAEYIQEFQNG